MLFELAAKGAKYVAAGKLRKERVLRGLRAVRGDESLGNIAYEEPRLLAFALDIRPVVADYIDCLIFSSAVLHADALVTEDQELRAAASQTTLREITAGANARFRVLPAAQVLGR